MARDRKMIKKEMTDNFIANSTVIALYGITLGNTFEQEFSLISIENILFDILSFLVYNHELIVSKNAENSRAGTIRWYQRECLNFLYGLPLVWLDGRYIYDLTGVADADVRQIIDRCAVLENNDGILVIKVATDTAGTIEPISVPQLAAFTAYLQLIKYAGTVVNIVNNAPDKLKFNLTVQVDPMIIDLTTGKLLNVEGNVYPVKDAVDGYLANLEFNGGFVRTYFQSALELARGVKNPIVNSIEWKYASFDFVAIGQGKIPEAGYFTYEDVDLIINYVGYDVANY